MMKQKRKIKEVLPPTNVKKKSKYILLVDDDVDFCRVLGDFLHPLGYECVLAYNIEEAVQLYKIQKPELVLLDLHFGHSRTNGTNFLLYLKQLEDRAGIEKQAPVVICSGLQDSSVRQAAKELGAFSFLDKPLDFSRLGRLVSKLNNH